MKTPDLIGRGPNDAVSRLLLGLIIRIERYREADVVTFFDCLANSGDNSLENNPLVFVLCAARESDTDIGVVANSPAATMTAQITDIDEREINTSFPSRATITLQLFG